MGTGGSGAGSQSKAATHARCYTPTPSEATLGCLPSSSPKLLEIGYLNDPLGSCGTKTLSAHGEPMPTSGTCKALADCCPEDVNPTYCAGLAAKGDERACANKLVDIPTCTLPPAETGGTLTCCYDACTTTYCVGRPIAIDGGLRLAALATRHDWA